MSCKGCGNNQITAGPRPYYEEVKDSVVEDHRTVVHENVYAAGVLVCDSWSTPEILQSVIVKLDGVTLIPVGAYLYNPHYGYYLITQWNPESGQIELINEGPINNAAPGTFVPTYTPFLISPKPCCDEDTSSFFPFLADNFIAPPANQSATIGVTSTFGLTVGGYVRIGTGVYRLDEIKSTTQIVIFNQGGGHTAGLEVQARDVNEELQFLITPEAAFVCTVDVEVVSGRLIVCQAGEQKIITGAGVGQVVRLVNPITGEVEFGDLPSNAIPPSTITSTMIVDGAVTANELATGSVVTVKIADGNVTTAKIADGAVTTAKLANDSVLTAKLGDAAVTNAKLAANAVLGTNIVDDAVTASKIAVGAVGVSEIAIGAVNIDRILDGNVSTAKLADGAVTGLKLAVDAVVASHIASFKNPGGVYTPTLSTETSSTGLTASGYYYIIGALTLVRVHISGQPSIAFSTLTVSLPTPTASNGSPGDSVWPAITETAALNIVDNTLVATVRKAVTNWALGGAPSSTGGSMHYWFNPAIGTSDNITFSAWGIYPNK